MTGGWVFPPLRRHAAVTARRSHAFVRFSRQFRHRAQAYVGLFGDNRVAVLDTATKQVMKTIPIPTGPHGLVMTPDSKRVYASSDGDSSVSVIDTSTDEVIA